MKSDAEGATAPETLRQKNRDSDSNFWRETPIEVFADGIIISGKGTEGAHGTIASMVHLDHFDQTVRSCSDWRQY